MRGQRLRGALACACALVTLAGCNGILPAAAQRLPPLHIAGLRRMDGLSNLNGVNVAGGYQDFAHEAPFQAGNGQWQVLLDGGGEGRPIAVASQDGSGFRSITMTHSCDSLARASTNGQWLACFNADPNSGASYIEVASLNANKPHAQWQIPIDVPFLFDPIFAVSPDGSYLAVVEPTATACDIVVYGFSADHSSATVATTLTSPAFQNTRECPLSALAWSSDGARLSMVLSRGTPMKVDEATPIARLLAAHTGASAIPQSAFTPFPSLPAYAPALNPRDGRIATGGDAGLQIVTLGPRNPHPATILFPTGNNLDYTVWSAEWTPDGKSLLLVIGPHMCVDRCVWGNYVRDVYLYTPPGAA